MALKKFYIGSQGPFYIEDSHPLYLSGEQVALKSDVTTAQEGTLVGDTTSLDLTLTSKTITGSVNFGTCAGVACQGNDSRLTPSLYPATTTVTPYANDGVAAYLAAAIVGGLITRDCAGTSGRADTLDIGTAIIAAKGGTAWPVGSSCIFSICNLSDANETIVVTGSTGTVVAGTTAQNTIVQDGRATYLCLHDATATVVCYRIG